MTAEPLASRPLSVSYPVANLKSELLLPRNARDPNFAALLQETQERIDIVEAREETRSEILDDRRVTVLLLDPLQKVPPLVSV